jgi:hypothetical protein
MQRLPRVLDVTLHLGLRDREAIRRVEECDRTEIRLDSSLAVSQRCQALFGLPEGLIRRCLPALGISEDRLRTRCRR